MLGDEGPQLDAEKVRPTVALLGVGAAGPTAEVGHADDASGADRLQIRQTERQT